MKSIKEMAHEHAVAVINGEYEEIEDTFITGANYVLEQIEKLTNNQNWCAFPKQSHKELKELFERLKN